jgi:hypothetical protein
MPDKPPTDSSDHAEDFAHCWADRLEEYCATRMESLGLPHDTIGEPDYDADGRWHAFDERGRKGGGNTTGITVDSGVLNPDLLKGKKGCRLWSHARLRDRIDAVIAHEYEELRHGSHLLAMKSAPNTELPISPKARRLCRAMGR